MVCKYLKIATALIVAGCGFYISLASPAKAAEPAPLRAAAQADAPYAALNRQDVPTLTAMAEAGDAEAQNNLGIAYENGIGVRQDLAVAVGWFRKAADQGLAEAQDNIGAMYLKGQGVPQDYAAALSWFRKAADQGNVKAQFGLGSMYYNSQGVPQDYVQAHKWFNLSAAGSTEADVTKIRDLLASKMTPAQIAEAQRLAREWRKK